MLKTICFSESAPKSFSCPLGWRKSIGFVELLNQNIEISSDHLSEQLLGEFRFEPIFLSNFLFQTIFLRIFFRNLGFLDHLFLNLLKNGIWNYNFPKNRFWNFALLDQLLELCQKWNLELQLSKNENLEFCSYFYFFW